MELTILIKTFDRKRSLWRLLKSLKNYENIKIIIADDSKFNYKFKTLNKFNKMNIDYYILPFDSGLSKGRNFILEKTETEYFLLCDDDFYIDSKIDFKYLLDFIKREELDILGGYLKEFYPAKNILFNLIQRFQRIFNVYESVNNIGEIIIDNKNLILQTYTRYFPEYTEIDYVRNFFIGNTNSIKKMGMWNEKLKLNEHFDFFYRAKMNHLKIAYTNALYCSHLKNYSNKYLKMRHRRFEDSLIDLESYEFKQILRDRP